MNSRAIAPIRRDLLAWYAKEARDLPWRRARDPYLIWLAEIILQQTRVDQGLPYYERFRAAFPTVHALAAASSDAVLKAWEGLGYYSRARNLHKAARTVVEHHGGTFPATAAELAKLPGVGPYTAGAVASIAHGEPTPAVDGNVKRVIARLRHITASVDGGEGAQAVWRHCAALVDPGDPGAFNQALMELGARVCLPRKPACGECPIARHCAARAAGAQDNLPVRKPKGPTPRHELAVAVVFRNGRCLIAKRPPEGLLGGLWEFPSGAVETGEDHPTALRRIMADAFGLAVEPGGLAAVVNHAYSHFKVTLNVYRCADRGGQPTPARHTETKWVRPADFSRYAFPGANRKFLPVITGAP